ncbi:MAG: hypothetical protein M1815_003968 [Lichina confinis]|nr:MAG: hypothetical protein M1815_003968 [Lichina confinis]
MARRSWRVYLPYVAALVSLGRAQLPYNPARVLRSTADDDADLIYFFLPSTSGSGFRLVSLNVSTTLEASNIQYTTLSPTLPFLDDSSDVAFTPVLDASGAIRVYAGTCASGATQASVWQFESSIGAGKTGGQWQRVEVREDDGVTDKTRLGPHHLASGISFSSDVSDDAESDIYVFGGMCPTDAASTDTWISAADYSETMLVLSPSSQSGNSSSSTVPANYDVAVVTSKAAPVAEAGYSLTVLRPSYLKSSGAPETRHQSFILLGGHTGEAFINMSQLALFSLPQETWSFPVIDLPSTPSVTDLAARQDPPAVDSRSGHTAVMTDDGKRVVVLGGWVGDINTPALPQVVVLELGEGYGGAGNWKWAIPTNGDAGLPDAAAIYGHGSVMLPGDVVMAVGGYAIPNGDTPTPEINSRTYFLNVTSGSWISTYKAPARVPGRGASSAQASAGLSSSAKKAALGLGIALGLCAIMGAIFVWLWYSRRVKRRREAREKELRRLGHSTQHHHPFDRDSGRYDVVDSEKLAHDGSGRQGQYQTDNPYSWAPEDPRSRARGVVGRDGRGTEAERTGLLVEIPSPTRGLRRSLQTRGRGGDRLLSYQLAPGREDVRRSFTGDIHPIDERDEFETSTQPDAVLAYPSDAAEPGLVSLTTAQQTTLDPFRDPGPLGHASADGEARHPSPARDRELEIPDWAAADAYMRGMTGGRSPDRGSPEKEYRTSSNLSDRSLHSAVSSHSQQYSVDRLSRTMSQRSAVRLSGSSIGGGGGVGGGGSVAGMLRSSSLSSAPGQRSGSVSPEHATPSGRSRSLRLFARRSSDGRVPSTRPNSMDFTQLQIEGEALLLPRPQTGGSLREDGLRGKSRTAGWLGSMRRALPFGAAAAAAAAGGGSSSSATNDNNSNSGSPEYHSASSSPIKSRALDGRPDADWDDVMIRRAASAGAAYWRTKQGAADWGAPTLRDRAGTMTGLIGNGIGSGSRNGKHETGSAVIDDDDEWDVEAAVERRVVQVMFTVPKEKLRVVNAGEEMSLLSENDNDNDNVDDGDDGVATTVAHGAATAAAAAAAATTATAATRARSMSATTEAENILVESAHLSPAAETKGKGKHRADFDHNDNDSDDDDDDDVVWRKSSVGR